MAKVICELGFKHFVDLTATEEEDNSKVVISYCVTDGGMHKNASITLTTENNFDLSTVDSADALSRANDAEGLS